MLQINTPKGFFELSEDVEIPVEEHNVVFSDKGSYTLPFKVPWTQRNVNLIGNPHILSNSTVALDIPVVITHNRFNKSGRIITFQADEDDQTIELSVLLDESAWHSWAKSTKLSDVKSIKSTTLLIRGQWWYTIDKGDGGGQLLNYWSRIFGWLTKYDLALRPDFIIDDKLPEELKTKLDPNDAFGSHSEEFDDFINKMEWCYFITAYDIFAKDDNLFKTGCSLLNATNVSIDHSAPYLFVRTIISAIFEGWQINNNIFTKGELARLTVLHGNKAILDDKSSFKYSDMCPSISVSEFISSLENLCGCRFIIDSISKVVTIKSLNTYIEDKSQDVIPTKIKLQVDDFKPIGMTIEVKDAIGQFSVVHDKASAEWEDLYEKVPACHNTYTPLKEEVEAATPWLNLGTERIYFDQSWQAYFMDKWEQKSGSKDEQKWKFIRKIISSRLYPVKKGDNDGIKVDLKGVGTTITAIAGLTYLYRYAYTNRTAVQAPFYPIGTFRPVHDYEEILFGEKITHPLMFAILRGYDNMKEILTVDDKKNIVKMINSTYVNQGIWDGGGANQYPLGSTDIYNIEGVKYSEVAGANLLYFPTKQLLALRPSGEGGIFETYYKEYFNYVTESVNSKVSGNYTMLSNIDIYKPIKINGYKQFIKSRKRTLTLHSNILNECELITSIYKDE